MRGFQITILLLAFLLIPQFCLAQHLATGPAVGQGLADTAQDTADAASDASEATEAAESAARAAEAAAEAAATTEIASSQAAGSHPPDVTLSAPGQGVTAARGSSPDQGVSEQDRAALDAVSVSPSAWNPF